MTNVSISNVRDFIQGYYNYFRNYLDNESLKKHIREQALYRAMQCVECLDAGKCSECGCATPAMFFSPNKSDVLGRWGKMLTAKEWESFKLENSIKLIENFEDIMFSEIRHRYDFKVIKPHWFQCRGGNCFDSMNPAFLMTLDEIFDRCDINTDVVVTSYIKDDKTEAGFGKEVVLNMEGYEHVLHRLVESAISFGLSVEFLNKLAMTGTTPVKIIDTPIQYLKVV